MTAETTDPTAVCKAVNNVAIICGMMLEAQVAAAAGANLHCGLTTSAGYLEHIMMYETTSTAATSAIIAFNNKIFTLFVLS